MKRKHTPARVGPIASLLILTVSSIGAFSIGLQTAGEGTVIDPIIAGGDAVPGDLNRDGKLTDDDAEIAIELAAGLRPATPEELKADPNQNGHITAGDALWIMDHIKRPIGSPTK